MASSETTGHAESAGAHGGGMPQLDFENWASQIFWAALALLLLYYILTRKILPRISGALEDRHNAIADDLDRAAELKRQAEDAETSYNNALAEARARANEIAEKTRAEINEQIEAENAKAEAEIAARLAEGEKRIGEIRNEAEASAKSIASEAAAAIVERLAPGSGGSSAVTSAVERVLAARGGLT